MCPLIILGYLYVYMKLIDIIFEAVVKYTDDMVSDEAKKYNTRQEFKDKSYWAYNAAKNRGILDSVCSHMPIPTRGIKKNNPNYDEKIVNANIVNKTTDDDLLKKGEEATKKYDNPKTFQSEEPSLYADLSDRKLLPKIAHLYKNRKRDKYTYDELKSVTSKYETKRDLEKENPRIYWAAYSSPYWNELTSHMKLLGNATKRMIYVYKFPEFKTVYVGLTGDEDARKEQHKTDPGSALYRFMEKHPGVEPIYEKATLGYIDAQEASKKETEVENEYRNNGWTLLNVIKTGGLGKTIVYTDNLVRTLAKNYTVLSDFWREHRKMLDTVSKYRKELYKEVTKNMLRNVKKKNK